MTDNLAQLAAQIAECKRLKLPGMEAFLQSIHDELLFLRVQSKALQSQLTLMAASSSVVAERIATINGHG